MCGLVSVITKSKNGFTNPSLSVFAEMLFMDTLRGPDSTGTFLVDKDGDVSVLKNDVPGWEFIASKSYSEHIDKPAYKNGQALVGHNRKATQGKVSATNAHPFVVNKEVVLVHNGTLTTHKHLGNTEVDSEAIAQYLHDKWKEDGTPDEKAEVLAHIGGAWALIWYDTRTNILNIVRNAQRPLHYAETGFEIYFSSEKGILEAALSRNNVGTYTIKEVPTYTVLSIDLEDKSSLKEVVLPTAPFFPTTKTAGKKDTQTTAGCTVSTDELSKNQFKRFVKNIVGKTIEFYVEDFVDLNTIEWHFYGQCYNYNFHHEIVGVVDAELVEPIIENYNCAEGEVVGVTFNPKTKLVSLKVKIDKVVPIEATTAH